MHAMQYEISLPADYDMGIIRRRVAERGHLLDRWEGLGLKAYLMRERGVHGSPVSQYAPFYLWNTAAGMDAFLWGAGFQGICDDFGRPPVRGWTGLAYAEGSGARARTAVRRRRAVPEGVRPADVAADALSEVRRLAAREGAVLAAAGVDPGTWESVQFSLWEQDEPEAEGEVFQVLHLSAPERDRLGR
ncbi:DUF4865 family protein [Streptomyces sp. NPDC057806]|uniref:DUF4865 family protein n=1 Tax=Streptomyces sp. NPDC057806 TaxID=3346255 RepID=UPI0036CD01F5